LGGKTSPNHEEAIGDLIHPAGIQVWPESTKAEHESGSDSVGMVEKCGQVKG